jgi:hypothetical protein
MSEGQETANRGVLESEGAVGGQVLRVLGLAAALVVVCGLAFVVLVGFVLPTRMQMQKDAQQVACMNNLNQIGKALRIYATNNKGMFPSLYSRAGTEEAAKERWGGSDAWDEKTLKLKDRGQEKSELKDHGPFTCNLHCLWMLVRSGACTSEIMICPADPGAKAAQDATPKDWWCFESLGQCSYSYQNQLGSTTRDTFAVMGALLADKSPMRADVQTDERVKAGKNKPTADADVKKWYTWNSPNHGWKGQSVLYGDGHVEFKDTPACGDNGNNIWIPEKWDAAKAEKNKWAPDEGIAAPANAYKAYDKSVANKKDSWLVP